MSPDFLDIESRIKKLLSQFGDPIPAYQIQDMRELCDAGEPGVAFENFCTQIFEFDISVSREQQQELRVIGSEMKIDPEYWEQLSVATDV